MMQTDDKNNMIYEDIDENNVSISYHDINNRGDDIQLTERTTNGRYNNR